MKKHIYFLIIWLVISAAFIIVGCASLKTFLGGSSTQLASTSIQAANAMRAAGLRVYGISEAGNWLVTPSQISGKILSVILPVGGREDEGIVAFGNGRPDIAPAESDLYPFDLSSRTVLRKEVIGLKPGYAGGQATQMILLFGYFDVEFPQNGVTRKIRFCYGDTSPYKRGDKLLYNGGGASTGDYYWYNTETGAFVRETETRPSSPEANAFVRDYIDSVRPNMRYYCVGVKLGSSNTDYDGRTGQSSITLTKSVVEDHSLTFAVDFDMGNAIIFSGVTSEAAFNALTDAQLIQKFDMSQNASGWENSNLYCNISFESIAKY